MAKVSVKGVFIGGVVDILTTFFFAFLILILFSSWVGLQHTPQNAVHSAITKLRESSLTKSMELLGSFGSTVLGGYVSAAIAKSDFLLNGTLSSAACLILGTCFIYAGVDHHSPLVRVALLASSPVMGFVGAFIRACQAQRSVV